MTVAELLDKYLAATEEERVPDGKWHPSSMFLCDRQAIYSVRGVPKTNPPDNIALRRFRIGKMLHELLQDAIGSAGTFEAEVEIDDPELNLAGHADGLWWIYVDDEGEAWVVEIKSTRALGKIKREGKPQDHHTKQAKAYAVALHKKYGDKLRGIIVVYLEKNDALTHEFQLDYDPEWEAELKQKIEHLEQYRLDPEALPPRLPLVKGRVQWPCNYCDWKDRCWDQDSSEVELTPVEEW